MKLELVLTEASIEISGATPGGEVAVLSVWRESGGGGSRVTILDESLLDEDEDGAVLFELDRSYPTLSVWLVVDVASGS